MRLCSKFSVWIVTLIALLSALEACAQSDFYKGKTITVYIGTTPGALYDQWGRILANHMAKHIPGNPTIVVQNMPGAGHMIAANYVFKTTKPDGLSLIGSIVPTLYFDQLVGRKEAQYDWAKFVWIGSPVQGESQMYMRADTPYKTMEDVRNAKEPPRYGAQGTSDSAYYLPKLFEEHGIRVEWQEYVHPTYPQLHGAFVPYLSALDLLLNCGDEAALIAFGGMQYSERQT